MPDATDALATDAFETNFAAGVGSAVAGIAVLHDGLNLLAEVTTESGTRYVLRRPRKLRRAGYMNPIETEYGVLERLEDTPVPAPAPVWFCDDPAMLGEPFFVMEHLDGESVPNGAFLPERFQTPEARERVGWGLVNALATIHSLAPDPFEGCASRTPLDEVTVALERLDLAESVLGREWPRLRRVGDWLRANAPSDSGTCLVHGDFRPSNVLFGGASDPEITGVLDWESAALGDPRTDLGYLLLHWHGNPEVNLADLETTYSDETIHELETANEQGLCPFTARPGAPSRRDLVARYERRTGIEVENSRYYRAHAAFLLAMVWEDLNRHAVESGGEVEPAPFVDYVALVAARTIAGGG